MKANNICLKKGCGLTKRMREGTINWYFFSIGLIVWGPLHLAVLTQIKLPCIKGHEVCTCVYSSHPTNPIARTQPQGGNVHRCIHTWMAECTTCGNGGEQTNSNSNTTFMYYTHCLSVCIAQQRTSFLITGTGPVLVIDKGCVLTCCIPTCAITNLWKLQSKLQENNE